MRRIELGIHGSPTCGSTSTGPRRGGRAARARPTRYTAWLMSAARLGVSAGGERLQRPCAAGPTPMTAAVRAQDPHAAAVAVMLAGCAWPRRRRAPCSPPVSMDMRKGGETRPQRGKRYARRQPADAADQVPRLGPATWSAARPSGARRQWLHEKLPEVNLFHDAPHHQHLRGTSESRSTGPCCAWCWRLTAILGPSGDGLGGRGPADLAGTCRPHGRCWTRPWPSSGAAARTRPDGPAPGGPGAGPLWAGCCWRAQVGLSTRWRPLLADALPRLRTMNHGS